MSLPSRPRFALTSRARTRLCLAAGGVAIATGTGIFHELAGWSIVDSLYVTAQIVATVGYRDLAALPSAGRVFGTGFMMVGVGIVLYALTSAVQTIVQSEMLFTLGQLRHSLKMSKLRDHFIICGAGRVGSHLIRGLQGGEDPFIVIEMDRGRVEALMDQGIPVL